MNELPDPGAGFAICDADDPLRTHFWCPDQHDWITAAEVRAAKRCEEKTGLKCGTIWRKPITTTKDKSMSDWVYFSEREPVEGDLPFVACKKYGAVNLFYTHSLGEDWHESWLAWRSIGPLPKAPVDEGVRLADEYANKEWPNHGNAGFWEKAKHDFRAGYAAGLKKGKG